MNEGPTPSLVARIRGVILATFDVAEGVAQGHASGLVLLAEGWGDPDTAQLLDWDYIVKKRLGASLPWRSDIERKAFCSERDLIIRSYEHYIQQNKRA
jgi:hypothetical protein